MNIPNTLSLFRLCLVPVFPLVYFSGAPHASLWAALVYAVAAFTDILDGKLARRLNQITRLGRLLDPLVDKLMGAAVIVCVAVSFPVLWWAAGVFFLKEGLMGVGALVQYKKIDDVPPSDVFGKFAVAVFFCSCLAILILRDELFGVIIPAPVMQAMMGVSMVLSVAALGRYLKRFIKLTGK